MSWARPRVGIGGTVIQGIKLEGEYEGDRGAGAPERGGQRGPKLDPAHPFSQAVGDQIGLVVGDD